MKPIKTIFFDLGNVIVRFDPEIVEKGYSAYGKIQKGKFVEHIIDSDYMNRYMEGKLTSSSFYTKTCRQFKLNIKYGEFYRIWNSMFYPYPEMEEIVKSLKEKYPDIKLVLVSNTNESHYDFLKDQYKILELLDGHVVSHEVGRQKPHADIFKEALRIAGTLPAETFYTDDRPDLIEAARVMGIRAFLFTDHEELRKQLAKFDINV